MSTMEVNTRVERDGKSDDETVSTHQSFNHVDNSESEAMIREYKCPISDKLPIDPVMASDVS